MLDMRTEEEFVQGHIPGVINIPNEQIRLRNCRSFRMRISLSWFIAAEGSAANRQFKSLHGQDIITLRSLEESWIDQVKRQRSFLCRF